MKTVGWMGRWKVVIHDIRIYGFRRCEVVKISKSR